MYVYVYINIYIERESNHGEKNYILEEYFRKYFCIYFCKYLIPNIDNQLPT